MALVLTRRPYESIQIGSHILVTIGKINRTSNQVQILIDAPPEINIRRSELAPKPPVSIAFMHKPQTEVCGIPLKPCPNPHLIGSDLKGKEISRGVTGAGPLLWNEVLGSWTCLVRVKADGTHDEVLCLMKIEVESDE